MKYLLIILTLFLVQCGIRKEIPRCPLSWSGNHKVREVGKVFIDGKRYAIFVCINPNFEGVMSCVYRDTIKIK